MWDEIIHPFLNFNGNLIPHFARHVITYPCWDLSQTMLVKVATGLHMGLWRQASMSPVNTTAVTLTTFLFLYPFSAFSITLRKQGRCQWKHRKSRVLNQCFNFALQDEFWIVLLSKHLISLIFPWTKWLPILKRYFQMHLIQWKVLFSD